MGNILVIEDDKDTRYVLKVVLENGKHSVEEAASGGEAVEIIENSVFDAIILDRMLGDMNGLSLLEKIKSEDKNLPVIILTGHADVQSAVRAMKMGALDYLVKPFSNEELLLIVDRAVKERGFMREFEALRGHIMSHNLKDVIFGESEEIKCVIEQISSVAKTDLTVILTGPSGCGKEVWARQLHKMSDRNRNPFIALDCGALPENLAESELFGYERGAFTGADRTKEGLLETVYGGTLFLDEISNLPLATQAKLLRVLQERKIRHLGGKKDIPVNVRIVVASNTSLPDAIKDSTFREDLFHRLNQFSIELPSLKERKKDIPALSYYFLKEANKSLKKNVGEISKDAMSSLLEYGWPGNIRELKNTITRAALMADKTIEPKHLGFDGKRRPACASPHADREVSGRPRETKAGKRNFNLKNIVAQNNREVEKSVIKEALTECGGNKMMAAKILGIDRKSLYNKIRKHNIHHGK